ncbi:class I SAM-dependent methyltransferase [Haloplanus sp. GCM10025708]|uniref:class I SAM-dependent methyltransferase n=1 Tax=Haloferacaceae TaxID=1644056 RepID=UPI00361CB49C
MTPNERIEMTDPAHPIFAKLYDPVMKPAERTVLTEHRRYLVDNLSGMVLDLGAGTGAMFPYFREAAADSGTVTLFAIEPDPHMRRKALERARDLGLEIEIENAGAEALPFADDSFDIVIASLVFCTIPDFDVALSEVARVLKPGGEFRFLEHVRGEGAVGIAHDVLAPAWHTLAGGCHLNRETDDIFRDDDRFELVDYTRLEDIPRIVPIVRGTLERRREDSVISRLVGAGKTGK